MKKLAEQFKALSDETRLKILGMLSQQELCGCELIVALDMSQSAVSHHLKILKNAGLVEDRRDGKWIFYRLHDQNIRALGERYFQEFAVSSGSCGENISSFNRDVSSICEAIMGTEKEQINRKSK